MYKNEIRLSLFISNNISFFLHSEFFQWPYLSIKCLKGAFIRKLQLSNYIIVFHVSFIVKKANTLKTEENKT